MDEEEKAAEIARLRERWADALRRRDVLVADMKGLEDWITVARGAFGNPYFYSGDKHGRPENAEQSASRYTGYASHDVVREMIQPTLTRLADLKHEMQDIREQLCALGVEV